MIWQIAERCPDSLKKSMTSFSKPERNALKKAFSTKLTPLCHVLVCGFSTPEHESELVKQGWCWWYQKYAPGDTVLEGLEKEAREAKKGLWVDPAPIPPWVYRKARRGRMYLPLKEGWAKPRCILRPVRTMNSQPIYYWTPEQRSW